MKTFMKMFAKEGKKIEILFRPLKAGDAKAAMDFINKFVDEKAYVSTTKEVTLKQENSWLKNKTKELKAKNYVHVLALHDGNIVGGASVERGKNIASHVGIFGIAIAKDFRGIGLGTFMVKYVIKEARQKLKSEIITLKVYSKNKPAQKLYKKLGFKVAGYVPRGIKHHGKYMDDITMYKNMK